jgi:hypothetical protein
LLATLGSQGLVRGIDSVASEGKDCHDPGPPIPIVGDQVFAAIHGPANEGGMQHERSTQERVPLKQSQMVGILGLQ